MNTFMASGKAKVIDNTITYSRPSANVRANL